MKVIQLDNGKVINIDNSDYSKTVEELRDFIDEEIYDCLKDFGDFVTREEYEDMYEQSILDDDYIRELQSTIDDLESTIDEKNDKIDDLKEEIFLLRKELIEMENRLYEQCNR